MTDVWEEQVAAHPIHAAFDELERQLDAADAVESLAGEAVTHLRRIRTALTNFRERLAQVQPYLVPISSLTNAVNHVTPAAQYVQTFVTDQNLGHLQNANGHIDNLLIEFRWLMPFTGRRESNVILKSARGLARTVDGLEANARQKLETLTQEISAAGTETAANIASTNATLESIKTTAEASVANLTAKIDASAAALTAEISAQKTRLDAYFEQQQTSHLTTQQEWQREFSETTEQLRSRARLDFQIEIDHIQQAKERFEAQSNQYIESLRKLEEEAQQITGVTAAAGVTGSYIKEAEQQRSTADLWRFGSVLFLLLTAAGALITSIWSPLNANVSPEEIAEYGLTRVPIVVVLGTITTYMAAQSAHHRNRERSARRRAMELTAFRPFIGELPPAEQHALIGETARKYFRADGDDAISAGPPAPS